METVKEETREERKRVKDAATGHQLGESQDQVAAARPGYLPRDLHALHCVAYLEGQSIVRAFCTFY